MSASPERITLAHGSGGRAMRDLIQELIAPAFANPWLAPLEDQARIELAGLAAHGDRLAFTTDSYVIDPIEFPGGDIGSLAVHGTVNDLAMCGARPLFLSCGFILEEGLAIDTLRRIVRSMRSAADDCGVALVTGDTKVVHRGAVDKIFVNTSGIGVIARGIDIAAGRARVGDVVIVNAPLGEHGAAILQARGDLALDARLVSDTRPLHRLVQAMLEVCPDVHSLRDATRGGLATVLNEFASAADVSIWLNETALPLREEVRGVCEILGLDPMYLANEGVFAALVPREYGEAVVAVLRALPGAERAAIVGEVREAPARVIMRTLFGGERIVDMLSGEQLPRIC